ncbi:PilZ domain-containing protein [Cohnella pontilimi]|uniref:PilZ domain-containing protein n=1 Tax=Cohnella pontilimi TaxID=2564100 RepID=A0A4U0FB59_9BACL|nr:PilZ domain-containing protein [Cohnella pontilimi]TJY41940.1 PilZ domain-containing protein [Cohnella pontilimi]
MHFSRREEAFRYEFREPLKGEFQITKMNGKMIESHFGDMEIIDVSLHGAKIFTDYDFHISGNEIELTLHFRIMSIEFSIHGILTHQEPHAGGFVCGIHLSTDDAIRQQLIDELKAYAWKLVRDKV